MKHHFKASKIITIQELLKLAEDECGSKCIVITVCETHEDVMDGEGKVTVIVEKKEWMEICTANDLVSIPKIIDLRIDREN